MPNSSEQKTELVHETATSLPREWEGDGDNPYIAKATSDHTRRAYRNAIESVQAFCGPLPITHTQVVAYLKHYATEHGLRTLKLRLTAIRQWHRLQGCPDPTDHPAVIKTLQGIANVHGKRKAQARALQLRDLHRMVDYLTEAPTLINIRNSALIQIGYFGAFRRSELVNLTWEHIRFVEEGILIEVPRSKTDPTGEGHVCPIPFGDHNRCPVQAILDWKKACKQTSGAVFRRIGKSNRISEQPISPHYVSQIIKKLAQAMTLPEPHTYSGHSLRRGAVTEGAKRGARTSSLQRLGRWRDPRMVQEYIEEAERFADSAVNVFFDHAN